MPIANPITRLLVTGSLIAVTSMAAAGCGGKSASRTSSSRTSSSPQEAAARAQLIAAADAICGRLARELAASKQKSLALSEIARFAPQNAALELGTVTELAKLTPPPSLARNWQQILTYRRTLAEELIKLGQDAKARNRAGIKTLAASKARVRRQLFVTATQNGFKQCSSVGSPGVARPGGRSSRAPSG